MSTTPSSNISSSANNSSSTLRPRNSRLISYLEDNRAVSDPRVDAIATSTSTSTSTSRGNSPGGNSHTRLVTKGKSKPSSRDVSEEVARRPSSGLWDSWSQIQGIASSFLGSDELTTETKPNGALKSPAWMKQDHTYSTSTKAPKWGPRSAPKVGGGTDAIEERRAQVQAKKREALLLSVAQEGRDISGRFKRKGSDASITARSSTAESTEQVLVYRHKVQPNDTMAGVTIKYSCQPEVFRKVNRLWPNDRIQTRKHVILPIDACAVRGRKIDDLYSIDLVGDSSDDTVRPTGAHDRATMMTTTTTTPPSSAADRAPSILERLSSRESDREEEHEHDSWIELPNFDKPVEILRIPSRTLGYFPPARRKSNHHLSNTSAAASVTSSPRSSFDTLRHPPTHAAQQAQLNQQHQQAQQTLSGLNASPVRRPRLSSRQRSTSTTASLSNPASASGHSKSSSQGTFLKALHGPGGVGTLRGLRTELSRPGPADDPLNQRFPNLAPYIAPPSLSLVTADYTDLPPGARSISTSLISLPRASMDSIRSTRSGRSNSSTSAFGAGVGDWVKKIAGAGRPGLNRTNSDRTIAPGGIGGETGLADLIELEGGTELLNLNGDAGERKDRLTGRAERFLEDAGREMEEDDAATPTLKSSGFDLGAAKSKDRTSAKSQEDLLNERFPITSRVTKAYAGD